MLRILGLLLAALTTISCASENDEQLRKWEWAQTFSNDINYIRDEKTGLCYAFYWPYYGGRGHLEITLVPCEAVEEFLITEPDISSDE